MYLHNAWYVAAWDHEIGDGPLARTLLNQKIVFFRAADKSVAALEDRCCHRAAPLSVGRVVDGLIECGYHGMVFNAAGKCVCVPSQETVPATAFVRSYPVAVKHRWVWIWMGEPELADEALIPDLYWHDHPKWKMLGDYFHVKCHYQELIDVQLDNTHSKYVHPGSLGNDGAVATPPRVKLVGDKIHGSRHMAASDPPPIWRKAADYKLERADYWLTWIYHAPTVITFDVGIAEPGTGAFEGNRSKGITVYTDHGITPETDDTTHHFWTCSRDFRLEDEGLTKTLSGIRNTFLEDVAICEAQHATIAAFPGAKMVDISSDAPTIQARRLLRRMREREMAAASESRASQ